MIDTHDNPVSFHPWQLGLEPPAGTYFELGGDGGAAAGDLGGGDAGAGAAVADPPDGGDGGAAAGGDLGGAADVEYLGADELADLVREQAGTAFSEMLARAAAEQQQAAQARQQAAQREAASTPPEWDPFDPNSVQAFIDWQTQQRIAPLLAQIDQANHFVEQGQLAEGKSQAESILEGFHKELGEFDHGKTILQAAAYMRQGSDPEAALAQAASEQAAYEAAIEARAMQKFRNAGQALADAGAEPAGGAGAAADVVEPLNGAGQRRDYKVEAKATMARLRGGAGVSEGIG